mgnify:CR=1 FL=1
MTAQAQRSHLDYLESEAVMIMREVAGQFERPALLFSGGKDSIALVKLAEKAFRPAKFPFPLVHVDTGHNFSEVIEYRDNLVKSIGEKLIVASVEDSIKRGTAAEEKGKFPSRNAIQAVTLLEAIAGRVLLGDGAMGTQLQLAGLEPGGCGERVGCGHQMPTLRGNGEE